MTEPLAIEILDPRSLTAHPRNYRSHPEDQLAQLCASLQQHGLYRNVVIAEDNTILAGHGVVEAAKCLNLATIGVVRLPIAADSPAALKVLTGDNELEHLAERDDRLLTELLKEISEQDSLLGTGFDEAMLANLLFVTRPASEIKDFDAAAHWVGMPDYDGTGEQVKLIITFDSKPEREEFMKEHGFSRPSATMGGVYSVRWPERETDDLTSLVYANQA